MQGASLGIRKIISICFAARKDAKSKYGSVLSDWARSIKERGTKSHSSPFPVSNFMEHVVNKYILERNQEIQLCEEKNIKNIFTDIEKRFFQLIKLKPISEAEKLIAKEELMETQKKYSDVSAKLKIDREHWKKANAGGVVTPDMDAANLMELGTRIKELEQEEGRLKSEESSLKDRISGKETSVNEKYQDEEKAIINLISDYGKQLKMLNDKIDLIENKYDVELGYYQKLLFRRKNIYVGKKSIQEICELCNKSSVKKKDLFVKQRCFINDVVRPALGVVSASLDV